MKDLDKSDISIYKNFSNAINKIFNSDIYLLVLSLCIFFSWFIECEFIAVGFAVASLCYMFLTQKHLDRIIPIAITICAMVDLNMRYRLTTTKLIVLITLVVLVAGCAVYHFVVVHEKSNKKLKTSSLFVGFALASVAGFLGGLGYEGQTFALALIAGGCGLAFLGLYVLLYKCTDGKSKDTVVKSIIALCIIIVLEMATYFMRAESFLTVLISKELSLGWAITNSVAVVLAMGIPMCFYLASKHKFQLGYTFLATVFLSFIFLTNCRSMMVAGIVVYFACVVIGFIKLNWWQLLVCILMAIGLAVLAYYTIFEEIFNQFKVLGFGGNGREEIFARYLQKFKENKMFGIGFYTDPEFASDGMVRAHNTILQILASTGIVGGILFAPYFYQRYKTMLTKISWFKVFVWVAYFAYAVYGLVDCGFISSYKLIMIYLLLFAVECDSIYQGDDKKMNENDQLKVEEQTDGVSNETEETVATSSEEVSVTEVKSDDTLGDAEEPAKKKKARKHWLYRHFFKRFFDILLSGLALIMLSPVFLVLSIIVRIKHGSPVLFKQPRPGKNNRLFMFAKYRSMTNARDENGALLPDDQRITKFGKMLRKTSLDELPQLWNIFKGDMSIVGPRPKLVQDMVFYNDEQNRRSEVRPGLTGLAQANGRNLNSWKETFEYDIFYVENCSLWLDIKIIFKTAIKIVKKPEITDTNATADEYHFGKHLLKNEIITQEEYDAKIEEAKKLMEGNNFKADICTVNQNKAV